MVRSDTTVNFGQCGSDQILHLILLKWVRPDSTFNLSQCHLFYPYTNQPVKVIAVLTLLWIFIVGILKTFSFQLGFTYCLFCRAVSLRAFVPMLLLCLKCGWVCAYQCAGVTVMNKYNFTKFRFIVLLSSCTYYWINIKFILNKFLSRLEHGSGFIL